MVGRVKDDDINGDCLALGGLPTEEPTNDGEALRALDEKLVDGSLALKRTVDIPASVLSRKDGVRDGTKIGDTD